MKAVKLILGTLAALAMATPALAVDVTFHGDLNHRINLYTNQSQVYGGAETIGTGTPVETDGNSAVFADIKYRLWADFVTHGGDVKGVYAIELGGIRFGSNYAKGGGASYSGDGNNIETRWAYGDIALPFGEKTRVKFGLLPFKANPFVWNETAMGIQLGGNVGTTGKYNLAWIRGKESFPTAADTDAFQDGDAILARGDYKLSDSTNFGLFALYQRMDAFDVATATIGTEIKRFTDAEYSIYTLGTDGSYKTGALAINWDAIYQGGTIDQPGDLDVSAFLLHADVGYTIDKLTLTYTGWYASGDDNAADGDVNNFMATDVDRFDSVVLFEGGYTDDNYFTEAPYILDKGLILNKLAADYQVSDKTKVGGALLYLMTAEDLANGEDTLGTEIDAYISHKLYDNVEVALNAGYLFADNGMDNFSAGAADDIFRSTMRVRYKF